MFSQITKRKTGKRKRRPVLTQANSKLADIIAEQEAIFVKRQPRSAALAERARHVLAGGVTSSWQITSPQPIWLSHGAGGKVYDADGNEYVDLHGGYGTTLAGHAHPAIVAAVKSQVERGTHFAQPTENAIAVAGELARRWGLPRWRFANSGTEATMDAVVIRPERARVEEHGSPGVNRVPALVDRVVCLGAATQVYLRLATGESLQAVAPNEDAAGWSQGTPVHVYLPADALRVLAGDAEPAPADAEAAVAS